MRLLFNICIQFNCTARDKKRCYESSLEFIPLSLSVIAILSRSVFIFISDILFLFLFLCRKNLESRPGFWTLDLIWNVTRGGEIGNIP